MPIELTTPADGGFVADGQTFTHAKIVHWEHGVDANTIYLHVDLGNMDGAKFKPSNIRQMRQVILIEGQDYFDLVSSSTTTAIGQNIYVAVKDALYQWLMDKTPSFAGTVV